MDQSDDAIYKGRYFDWFVCIRPAKLDDYDDVMKIGDNIYGGADYLAYDYHDMLANSTAHSYVAEVNGRVSVFVCFSVDGVDNIMTTSTAGRVAPKYRHRGLYLFVKQVIREDMKKKYPSLQYNWNVSFLSDRLVSLTLKDNGRLLEKKKHIFCTMPPANILRETGLATGKIDVWNPNLPEVIELLDKREPLEALYPKSVLIHATEFMPVSTKKSALEKAFRKGMINLSGSVQSQNLALSTAYVRQYHPTVRVILSYDGCPDVATVISHLMKTFANLAESGMAQSSATGTPEEAESETDKLKLILSVLLPYQVDIGAVAKLMRDLFSCDIRENFFPALALYETPYQ